MSLIPRSINSARLESRSSDAQITIKEVGGGIRSGLVADQSDCEYEGGQRSFRDWSDKVSGTPRKLLSHALRVALDYIVASGSLASTDLRRGCDAYLLDVHHSTAIQRIVGTGMRWGRALLEVANLSDDVSKVGCPE